MNKLLKKILIILFIILLAYIFIFRLLGLEKIIMQKIYPKDYRQYVRRYSIEYNVDELLIYSIIKVESNFKENATSNSDAKGLMQLMENTAFEMCDKLEENIKKQEIYNPQINIKIGTYYFSTLLKKYNNVGLALAAYNAGMGRVDEWLEKRIIKLDGSDLENIPYKETNMYVRRVLNSYEMYKELY